MLQSLAATIVRARSVSVSVSLRLGAGAVRAHSAQGLEAAARDRGGVRRKTSIDVIQCRPGHPGDPRISPSGLITALPPRCSTWV